MLHNQIAFQFILNSLFCSLSCGKQSFLNFDYFQVANCKIMNKMMDQMVYNENILLMTIGFSLSVVHPHTVIIQAHQNGLIDQELGRLACTVATNFFKYTILCLRYEPAFLACVCIHLAAEHLKSQVINSIHIVIATFFILNLSIS